MKFAVVACEKTEKKFVVHAAVTLLISLGPFKWLVSWKKVS